MLLASSIRRFTRVAIFILFLTMFLPLNILSNSAFAQTKASQCHPGQLCSLTGVSPTNPPNPQTTTNLTVTANQDLPGLDTGIDLASGNSITITASGQAAFGTGDPSNCSTTEQTVPDGHLITTDGTLCDPKYDPSAVLPSAPVGELLAQIGSSGWFAVGSSDGFSAATSGRLFLLYNDISGQYGNNSGSYQATVTVTSTCLSSSLTVQTVWTRDGNGNNQSNFAPGDAIQYAFYVNNSCSETISASVNFQALDPNGNKFYDQTFSITLPVNVSGWYVQSTIPNNALKGQDTIKVVVQDQNNSNDSSAGQNQFTVRGRLFLFIQGINSTLSTYDATHNIVPTNQYSFGQTNGIYPFLLKTYPTAQFRMFSYNGADSSGTPTGYQCQNTFTQHLKVYVSRLLTQIKNLLNQNPNTDVYLIGHSMGGTVALGLLAYFRINGFPSINGGKIAGVVSLDSPVGGVEDEVFGLGFYFTKQHFQQVCPALVPPNKPALPVNSLQDLFNIYDTGSSTPHGGINSIMLTLYGGDFTNQQVATDAASHNALVLTIGNVLDYTYDPGACQVGAPDFLSTQWLADQGNNSGVYGRVFQDSSGLQKCTNLSQQIAANHFDVLRNATVQTGLQEFVVGQTPSALTVALPGH